MPFISITRLRIRSIRFMPAFALYTLRSLKQVRASKGFQDGSLLPDRKFTFWTMTQWDHRDSMRHYITTGAHMAAMPKLLDWCDEASLVHWDQPGTALPTWAEADERMRSQGRISKVRHPSPRHANMSFATPRLRGAGPIQPSTR